MNVAPVTIEATTAHRWKIRVERQFGGKQATGEVVVRQKQQPDAQDPPHRALAGARAWKELAEAALQAGDAEGAISCGESGLEELGRNYAPLGTKDDTKLKLLAANELVQQERTADGAELMLHMLGVRMELYTKLHRATLV